MTNQKHPNQPLYNDEDGRLRFKKNAIVRYLLEAGSIGLNDLGLIPFSLEDRKQFYQLIGTSKQGFFDMFDGNREWPRDE